MQNGELLGTVVCDTSAFSDSLNFDTLVNHRMVNDEITNQICGNEVKYDKCLPGAYTCTQPMDP